MRHPRCVLGTIPLVRFTTLPHHNYARSTRVTEPHLGFIPGNAVAECSGKTMSHWEDGSETKVTSVYFNPPPRDYLLVGKAAT